MTSAESVSTIRVRFAETDKFGYAYHGAYFAWFEVGRTEWLRARGVTYVELMGRDIHLPVVSTDAKFLRPVGYDDRIEIRTRLDRASRVRIVFHYELRREGASETLTRATTEHAAVDSAGRLKRFPEDIMGHLK